METKRCNLCKTDLPATVEYFHKRSASSDGLSYTCRSCAGNRANQWHSNHPRPIKPKSTLPPDIRHCCSCKEDLPVSSFYRYFRKSHPGKVFYSAQCKDCKLTYNRKHYASTRNYQFRSVLKNLQSLDDLKTSDNPYIRVSSSSVPASSTETPARGRPRSSKTCEPIYQEAQQRFQELKAVTLPEIPGLY